MAGFTISNNGIALLLGVWAVFTNVKDGISTWAVAKANQSAINERVVKIGQTTDMLAVELGALTKQVSALDGSLKSEISRSYGYDESTGKTLDFLTSIIKAQAAPYQQAKPTPETKTPP